MDKKYIAALFGAASVLSGCATSTNTTTKWEKDSREKGYVVPVVRLSCTSEAANRSAHMDISRDRIRVFFMAYNRDSYGLPYYEAMHERNVKDTPDNRAALTEEMSDHCGPGQPAPKI